MKKMSLSQRVIVTGGLVLSLGLGLAMPRVQADEFAIGSVKPSTMTNSNAETIVQRVITIAIVAGALLCLYNLIMGAINWITSEGDKGKTEEARNRMLAAAIGILLLASVWAIFNLVITIGFGDANKLSIPTL
ncbi:hypothetical protein IJJ08_01015 [bacterium]|nr:hypothetical protein [bacterium]